MPGCTDAVCSMLVGKNCQAHTYPYVDVQRADAQVEHEASTSRLSEDQLFYLQARGIPEADARRLVVRGFFAELIAKIGVPAIEERLLGAIEAELARSMGEIETGAAR